MLVIVNKYILAKKFDGIVLWPFVFVKRNGLKRNPTFMNHERIHAVQQKELLVLPFFIWYFLEYLIRLFIVQNSYEAYNRISFEREAYENEENYEYLSTRKIWGFLKYM